MTGEIEVRVARADERRRGGPLTGGRHHCWGLRRPAERGLRISLCTTLLFLGLAIGAGASAQSQCTNAVVPPTCVFVDDSGDVHEDYRVTNRCTYAVTLWFDVSEKGDDWILDRTNFTAMFRFMAVQPGETEPSGIRYDAALTVHCCPDFDGTSCSDQSSPEVPK